MSPFWRFRRILCLQAAPVAAGIAAVALALSSAAAHAAPPSAAGPAAAARCPALSGKTIEGGTITSAKMAGGEADPASPNALPSHCEIFGIMHERIGIDGQHYAIRFHMRLPEKWNRRFLFQGGGGTNGDIGSAIGLVSPGSREQAFPPALARGYAVVSQDSGHDNNLNLDPKRGGTVAFGYDPQARADYGNASLAPVAHVAKAIVTAYYEAPIARSYFVGCSKGGEEGMVFAQQHPDMFDGIVAAAPGFALPRAAVEQTYDVQMFAALARRPNETHIDFSTLHSVFSGADMGLVAAAVAEACDALDGLKDGIVGNVAQCTTSRVEPQLARRTCTGSKTGTCLSASQVAALLKVMSGGRTSDGKPVYSDWAWDIGIGGDGWRAWKIGSEDGKVPALNVLLGGASLPAVFSMPPTSPPGDPQSILDWQMQFDLDRDAKRIYATGPGFSRSGWQDVSARSPDLAAFEARGGKLIVPQGVSDPVFSINDTIAWYHEVDLHSRGRADSFVRLFPVPGMAHCSGGPATDRFDTLGALEQWVEKGVAPEQIVATANSSAPWPGRSRPLCPFPKVARYTGNGSIERAENFRCMK